MSHAVLFWCCFGGYLLMGFVATFGWEMYGPGARKEARGVFQLFAVAVALNMFLFPLISSSLSGNALSLAESDAITEAGNFLGPLDQVFQFLEDGTTVRIAAAIGSGDFVEAGTLIKLAIYSGLGSGAVAAGFIIPMAFIKPLFSFFVPFSMGAKVPHGCDGGPTATDLQSYARSYWILSALTLPFAFASKCSLAFFLGSQSFKAWVVAGIISAGLGVVLTYVFVVSMALGTTGMGLVGLVSAPLFVATCIGFLMTKDMRDKYAFTSFKLPPGSKLLLVRSAKDGLKLMIKDLLGSIAGNLPSMFLAQLSLGLQYAWGLIGTVTSKMNVFSQFLALMGRLRGARLLGAGQHAAFREFATKLLIQGLLCGSAGALAAMVGVSALPLGFASSSLKRLEQSNCTLPLYNEVVDSATGGTYFFSAILILVGTLNVVYNALLYAFRDFSFLLRLGVLNFVVGVPLQILAFVVVRTLFSIAFASNVTSVMSFCLYVYRFHWVLMRQLPEEDTDGEFPVLPEHGFQGVASVDEGAVPGTRPKSLLDMATGDLESLILSREERQRLAAGNARPQSMNRGLLSGDGDTGVDTRRWSAPVRRGPGRARKPVLSGGWAVAVSSMTIEHEPAPVTGAGAGAGASGGAAVLAAGRASLPRPAAATQGGGGLATVADVDDSDGSGDATSDDESL